MSNSPINLLPSDLAYVPFVSVDNMMRNVRAIGGKASTRNRVFRRMRLRVSSS